MLLRGLKEHLAIRRVDQPQQPPPHRGLAAARFPNHGQCLAVGHRGAVHQRLAEVQRQHVPQEIEVLVPQRQVQTHLLTEQIQLLGRRVIAKRNGLERTD